MKTIHAETQAQLHLLWKQTNAFGFCQSDAGMKHFVLGMMKLLKAHSASWIATTSRAHTLRDPGLQLDNQWTVLDIVGYEHNELAHSAQDRLALYLDAHQKYGWDPLTLTALKNTGFDRTLLREDAIDDTTWQDHWLRTEYFPLFGRQDTMVTVHNVDNDCESFLLFHRPQGEADFSQDDRQLLAIANAGISHLHRSMMLLRGALEPTKEVLNRNEQALIKQHLGSKDDTPADPQQTAALRSIYGKFQVANKEQLLSYFLNA